MKLPFSRINGSCSFKSGTSGSGSYGTHTTYPLLSKNLLIDGCQNDLGVEDVAWRMIAFFIYVKPRRFL
ncbi:MAG: hypothetical protein KKF44_04355 [Nanoarchaeota archaeon]|nr:hypothetical protein [Nanoarchaeota archaeon]